MPWYVMYLALYLQQFNADTKVFYLFLNYLHIV